MQDTSYFVITSIHCISGAGNYTSWHAELIDKRTTSSIVVHTGSYVAAVNYVVYGYAAALQPPEEEYPTTPTLPPDGADN